MAGIKGMKTGRLTDVEKQYHERFLEHLDQRTHMVRVLRGRLRALQTDLGGADRLSYQQSSLCRRAIHLERRIEQSEEAIMRGEDVDVGSLTQGINALVGLFRAVGLERVARDVPDLRTYLANREAEQ